MELRVSIVVVMMLAGVTYATDTVEDEDLVVPQPVMEFIMDCRRSRRQEDLIPVMRTDIDSDSGTTSQHVTLLELDELQASLKSTIKSDKVAEEIVKQIREEISHSGPSFRTENCPPTINTINITVPPQELVAYNLRLERVMQQNNNVLLGLVNDMITAKFSTLQKSLEQLIEHKTNSISDNLSRMTAILKSAGTDIPIRQHEQQDQLVTTEEMAPVTDTPSANLKADDNILAEVIQAIHNSYNTSSATTTTTTTDAPVTALQQNAEPQEISSRLGIAAIDAEEHDFSELSKLLQGPFTNQRHRFPVRLRGERV